MRCAGRRLFGMQICWLAGLRGVAFEPSEKIFSAWQTTRDNIAEESLALHDRDIRLPGNGDEIIGCVASQRTRGSKMKWHRNLMHGFTVELPRSDARAHKSDGSAH